MKISLIITTKNESTTISGLLESIAKQTRIPDEIIIANAGTDDQLKRSEYIKMLPITILELHHSANRAVGRNRAIEAAKNDHILITDAGCRLKEDWVDQMVKGFAHAEVVAGFYRSDAQTVFEKCVAPYALVMPDRINTKTFLPATRSMGITKKVWEKAGKFDEHYRFAEDYEFARRIQKLKIPIFVASDAIVYWRPRQNLFAFIRMVYEHAYGDGYSHTFRLKVALIFIRYALWVAFFPLALGVSTVSLIYFTTIILYLLYSIQKNYRYVEEPQALGILPLLQITSDLAVMLGTLQGYAGA